MPKERRANKGRNRVRPTGLPTVAEAMRDGDEDETSESGLQVEQNVPIFQKLQSKEEGEREIACNAIANLVLEEEEAVRVALTKESLAQLVSCLADPSLAVRIAATGALNNLATVAPVTAFPLLHAHVTDTLLSVLQQNLRSVNDPARAKSEEEMKQLCTLMAQTLSLLSSLSENSDEATTTILRAGTLGLIVSFLKNPESVPSVILLSSAGLLQVLTDCEDDRKLDQWLSADDRTALVNLLHGYMSTPKPDPRFVSLLAGSVVNIGGGKHPDIIKALIPALELCWRFDGLGALLELSQYLQDAQNQQKIKEETVKAAEEALENWRNNMTAQQAGFEIFTNICSSIEETAEKDSLDDAALDEEEEVDEATVMAVNMDEATAIAPEVLAVLPMSYVMAKVVEKLQWDKAKVSELGEVYGFMQKCITSFHDVQARALSCLNNMLLVLPLPQASQQAESLWDMLVKLCADAGHPLPAPLGNEASIEILELTTACMWTLLRKATQRGYPISPHSNVVEGMVQLAAGCPSFVARTNAVGCLGIMGQHPQLLGQAPSTPELPWSEHGSVVAEGLNSIFDMFSEEDKDAIFTQLAILPKLRAFSPLLRNKIRREGRSLDRGLAERLKETKLNLDRFIQYKARHVK